MNIENIIIVDQAKNLRKFAKITIEEMVENTKGLTATDFINYENNELYSTDVVDAIYTNYLFLLDKIYSKRKLSFLDLLERFCKEYELDSEALKNTYLETMTEMILSNSTRNEIKDTLKFALLNSKEYYSMTLKSLESSNKAFEAIEVYKSAQKETHDAYVDARNAWTESREKAEILTRIIASDKKLKKKIIPLIKEDMESEREDDFAEFAEKSYMDLTNDLNTYWDFIKA